MTKRSWFERSLLDQRNVSAIVIALCVGLAYGELRGLPRVAAACEILLPAAVFHLCHTFPGPAHLLRFFPSVATAPYLVCLVLAGVAVRSVPDRPEAFEAATLLGSLLLVLAYLNTMGRILDPSRRRGREAASWLVFGGAGVSLASLLWRRLLGGSEEQFLVGVGVLPLTLVLANLRGDLGLEPAEAPAESPDPEAHLALDPIARQIAHAMLKPIAAAAEQLKLLAARTEDLSARGELESTIELMGQIQRLVRDLVDLARAQKGSERRRVKLRSLVDQAVAETRIRHREAALDVEVADEAILADELGVRCALVNLMENAIEASPPGWVRVRGERRGGSVRILVEDRSGGIALDVQQRLFEPFVTTKARGTGLGLAVVQEVIRAHGGQVEARATGAGTRFSITLPAAR